MSREELQEWLLDLQGFRGQLLALTKQSVSAQFPLLGVADVVKDVVPDWHYLLFCASLLATSNSDRAQDAALRIAQHCLTASAHESHRVAAAFILDQLANQPAIALGQHRDVVPPDLFERLGDQPVYEHSRRQLDLTVESASGETLHLNRFQKAVWDGAALDSWVSISAPTSAGKSFVIKKLIEDQARSSGRGIAVYVVPTRALIQEVESDFIHYFKSRNGHTTSVSSMPLAETLDPTRFNVLVLTQERFHILLTARPKMQVDLLVVDEAHKIADRQRGVLLQQVIDRTAEANPKVRVLFASPHTENPGVVLAAAPPKASRREICVQQVTVNQNLLWARQKPYKPKEWTLGVVVDGSEHPLGDFSLVDKPQPVSKRLPFVAHALGQGGGNLLYVNSASDAEKTANQLYELLPSTSLTPECAAQVQPLIELARDTVHKGYALAKVLRRGVAFHYGNMPYLMRTEIERLFRDGHIRYLVCTSTLLEGVNLPCRNIFVRGPRTGRGNPMTASDFWNLAGRAGRWGSEFQGNIVCIDVSRNDLWPNGAPSKKVPTKIEPAVATALANPEGFADWSAEIPSTSSSEVLGEFPQVLNYLVREFSRRGTVKDSYSMASLSEPQRALLEQATAAVTASLVTPAEIVSRNPGIDPRLMDNMLRALESRQGSLHEILPPDAASDDAVQTFCRVFALINDGLGEVFGGDKRVWQLALMTTQWLRGHSLASLIEGRINALKKRGQEVSLPKEIRNVMGDVEKYPRFLVPKYLACYVDLLRHHLTNLGEVALLGELNDYGLMLEFGVSEDTQVSLISMGLSRTTVVSLFELMPSSDWTVHDCLNWLREQDVELLDVPTLVRREIQSKFPELAR